MCGVSSREGGWICMGGFLSHAKKLAFCMFGITALVHPPMRQWLGRNAGYIRLVSRPMVRDEDRKVWASSCHCRACEAGRAHATPV